MLLATLILSFSENAFQINDAKNGNYPQYLIIEGLIYFEDWNRNLRLCVPDSLHIEVTYEKST